MSSSSFSRLYSSIISSRRNTYSRHSTWESTSRFDRPGRGHGHRRSGRPRRYGRTGGYGNLLLPSRQPRYMPGWHRPRHDRWLWLEDERSPLYTDDDVAKPWRRIRPVKRGTEEEVEKPRTSVSINLNTVENRKAHHTDVYESPDLILRRGQEFKVTLTLDWIYSKDTDAMVLQFAVGDKPQQSKCTLVRVRVGKEMEPGQWSAKVSSATNSESKSELELLVVSGCEAVVGEYMLFIETYKLGDKEAVSDHHRQKHAETVCIIFNPWCKDDVVYMEDESERDEYVMNETGRIMVGKETSIHNRPWNFGQFDKVCLEAALYLLGSSYLGVQAHGNPTLVTRAITAMSNSNDQDGGVLTGNWSGRYVGGTAPTEWNGSVAILDAYMASKRDVKYGQCWIFSGLITTLCRALGIPTRSVTNFESAHDTDLSLTIDSHVDSEGLPLKHLDDSVWNFHVWNESWFKRPDLPEGNDGWQAVDSTPQEQSEDMMRCGPAPLAAIKSGNVFLGYDVMFVFAEVNGDRVTWLVNDVGESMPLRCRPGCVGKFISTKAVGSNERQDITSLYKFPEGSDEERAAVENASQHSTRKKALGILYNLEEKQDVAIAFNGEMAKNGNLTIRVLASNQTEETRTVRVRMCATAKYYNGVPGEELDNMDIEVALASKEEKETVWPLRAIDVINRLEEDATVGVYVMAKVKETDQLFTGDDTFFIDKPDLDIKVVPSSVKVGEDIEVTITFENPLELPLINGVFRLEGAGIQKDMKIALNRTIKPLEKVTKTVTLTPMRPGKREIIATFHSAKLVGIDGAAQVEVRAVDE